MSLTRAGYTKDWTNPTDFPTIETSESQVRSDIQNLYNQIRDDVNVIATELEATTDGSSGADQIGNTTIEGVTGTTVQATMEGLKAIADTKETIANVALKESIADANLLVKTIEFTPADGKFKITTQGGTITYIDTNLEKVPGSMSLVEDPTGSGTYYLVIYDTSTPPVELSRCPVSTLFNPLDTENTATVSLSLTTLSTGHKKLTASVIDGSITLAKLESSVMTTLQGYVTSASTSASNAAASATNASSYADAASASATTASNKASEASGYADNASDSADAASGSATSAATYATNSSNSANTASTHATTASDKATLAESWAVGGTGTRTGEDTNNAKYWCEQAGRIAGADMLKAVYDPTTGGTPTPVAAAGGIPAYVANVRTVIEAEIPDALADLTDDTTHRVVTDTEKATWNAKQNAIDNTTDLVVKTLTGGLSYTTTAPTAANTDGIKIAVLSSEPSTKYAGWLYLITG